MADVVVIPGRLYGPGFPLLMYSSDVAAARGARVHRHNWTEDPPEPLDPGARDWVWGQVTPLVDKVGGTPLVIAKSLGTQAASLAAERGLPAIWMTPLLTGATSMAGALERATAPFLLVGGTADPLWDSALARRLTPHVMEVEGADHGMYVPGPLTKSIDVLRDIVLAVESFLDTIGWPPPDGQPAPDPTAT
jgi:pimeloyl-ACP methyl ester carboxylesterase